MPNANYTIKFGESIYDVANKLYGSVESATVLFLENTDVISDMNTDLEGITIVYNTAYKSEVLEVLNTKTVTSINLAQIYLPNSFQTIFDITLMTDGNLESVINLVHNSTLNNINTEVKITDRFNYTLKSTGVLDWVAKNGIIFQTKTPLLGNDGNAFDSSFDGLAFN